MNNADMPIAMEWTVALHKTFRVTAKAWSPNGEWRWNVYAHIYITHPLFSEPKKAMELPLHGGCTFDALIKTEPTGGNKYDRCEISEVLTIGSGYMHCDDNFEHVSGFDGVPYQIEQDAKELSDALLAELEK